MTEERKTGQPRWYPVTPTEFLEDAAFDLGAIEATAKSLRERLGWVERYGFREACLSKEAQVEFFYFLRNTRAQLDAWSMRLILQTPGVTLPQDVP